MKLEARLVGRGVERILALNIIDRSFGHVCLDLLMAAHAAREANAMLCVRIPRAYADSPINSLMFEGVRVIRETRWQRVLVGWLSFLSFIGLDTSTVDGGHRRSAAMLAASSVGRAIRKMFGAVWRKLRLKIYLTLDRIRKSGKSPQRVANWLKPHLKSWKSVVYAEVPLSSLDAVALKPESVIDKPYFGYFYRHAVATRPLRAFLPEPLEAKAREHARSHFGVHENDELVVLHVREDGYKARNDYSDSLRNADIRTYRRACEWLVGKGFKIVRMGDPAMRPIDWPGVVDLATSPKRSELVELWCLLRSRFFWGCESGPYAASLLAGVPSLMVNAYGILTSFPIHRRSLYILKHVRDERSGRTLTLREQLNIDFIHAKRDFANYRWIDNTPDEILEAVKEMTSGLSSEIEEIEQQRTFRTLLRNAAEHLHASYARKLGDDPVFLGLGNICAGFAKKYLDSAVSVPAAGALG